MTTFTYPGPPRPRRVARVRRWLDRDLHRYLTNALLLVGLLVALSASLNWTDIVRH